MRTACLLLLLLPSFLGAQSMADWKHEFVIALTQYRNQLIEKAKDRPFNIQKTMDRWTEIESNEDVLLDFIFQAKYAYSLKEVSYKDILDEAEKGYPGSPLVNNFSEEELKSLATNAALVDLINFGVLEYAYPFRIRSNEELYEEIDFYQLKEGEKFAEIGAGTGVFSQMLGLIGKNSVIYVNEIDEDVLQYLRQKKAEKDFELGPNATMLVEGGKKNANLPEKVDKVFIRNTFHHFSKKEQMLNSICNSIQPGGRIYIYETLKDPHDPNACKHRMYDQEIKSFFLDYGLVLENEKRVGKAILLEYALGK